MRGKPSLEHLSMSQPGRNYRDRLVFLAKQIMWEGQKVDMIKQVIEEIKIKEGTEVGEDFANICRELWKWETSRDQ